MSTGALPVCLLALGRKAVRKQHLQYQNSKPHVPLSTQLQLMPFSVNRSVVIEGHGVFHLSPRTVLTRVYGAVAVPADDEGFDLSCPEPACLGYI